MWLVHRLGVHSRIAIASSAAALLGLVLFFAEWISIIPMPAMAAIIMLLGSNMINWEDIKPHMQDKREAVVFFASFLSVLFLDLFGAVVVGSLLAVAYAKWAHAHPNVTIDGSEIRVRGNVYYGSLPVIEAAYQSVIQQAGRVTLDFSTCHYIDREGLRWLSELKRRPDVTLIDRRSTSERRHQERRGGADPKRAVGRRRSRGDRRRRDEV